MLTNSKKIIPLSREIRRSSGFDSIEEEAWLNLMLTYKNSKGELDLFFKNHGTSGLQFEALKIINEHGNEGIPVRKIAALMVSENPDITRIIDRLEVSHLVERIRGEADRRIIFVRITDKGKHFLDRLMKPLTELHQNQFNHLNKNEINLLNTLLQKARLPK